MNIQHSCFFCDKSVELGVNGISSETTGAIICFDCIAGLSELLSHLHSSGYFASTDSNQVSNASNN